VDFYFPARVDPAVPIEEIIGAIADSIREGKVLDAGLSESWSRGADIVPVAGNRRGRKISASGNVFTEPLMALYLEDLHVGQQFTSGEYLMTEERIKTFAAEFDPQPFHLDPAAAQTGFFRGLVASGWHTAAVSMRLLVAGGLPFANGLIGVGGEIAWPRPTRPGDIVRLQSEIVEIRLSRSKPDRGIVSVKSVMRNQRGEEVQIFTAKILVFKRPATE
jgi:acyl dehydratase